MVGWGDKTLIEMVKNFISPLCEHFFFLFCERQAPDGACREHNFSKYKTIVH